MCGICGIVNNDRGDLVAPEDIRAMREALKHRGPDEQGDWTDGCAGLGHRRLSVIDIEGGRQPMSNEDGSLRLVLNGEIYNYLPLRDRLVSNGHTFKTESDAEVLLHLYEEEGHNLLGRLVGMFAFAIWDAGRSSLFLARDHIGQKPLYYWKGRRRFAFASELKSFRTLGDFREPVSREAVCHYLTFQYIPHPLSIFENVYKLPPAHYAILRDGALDVRRYWNPFEPRENKIHSVREVIETAVESCMVSDVPVGAFLSGGIDSTIVTGLMSRASKEKIRAFTIGFEEHKYDERDYAAEAAKFCKVEHIQEIARADILDMFDKLVRDLDEPMGDSSAVPMSLLARMASSYGKVALSGDGGDEIFLGYMRYAAVKMSSKIDLLPGRLRRLLFGNIWNLLPAPLERKTLLRRCRRFAASLDKEPMRRYYNWISVFSDEEKAGLLGDDCFDSISYLRDSAYAQACDGDVEKASAFDIEYYLPCDLMTKVDRICMAHSLEVRSPFLDHRVVEAAVSISDRERMKGLRDKYLLRRTFRDLLPRRIRKRDKMGFGVPISRWMREDMRGMTGDLLLGGTRKLGAFVDGTVLSRLVSNHLEGRCDSGAKLWALLCLERWMREFA